MPKESLTSASNNYLSPEIHPHLADVAERFGEIALREYQSLSELPPLGEHLVRASAKIAITALSKLPPETLNDQTNDLRESLFPVIESGEVSVLDLNPYQIRVFHLSSLGNIYTEIARNEKKSPQTIANLKSMFLNTLGVKNEIAAVKMLFRSGILEPVYNTDDLPDLDTLTPREREVVFLLSENFTYKDIALQLSIKSDTLKHFLMSAMKKLNAGTRAHAGRILSESGFFNVAGGVKKSRKSTQERILENPMALRIFNLYSRGESADIIAERTGKTVQAVHDHKKRFVGALGVKSYLSAAKAAFDHGKLEPIYELSEMPDLSTLSDTEREVLYLSSQNLSYAEIAKRLSISIYSVGRRVSSAYKKLNAKNRLHAGRILFEAGFFSDKPTPQKPRSPFPETMLEVKLGEALTLLETLFKGDGNPYHTPLVISDRKTLDMDPVQKLDLNGKDSLAGQSGIADLAIALLYRIQDIRTYLENEATRKEVLDYIKKYTNYRTHIYSKPK